MMHFEKTMVRSLAALDRVSDSYACEISVTGARVFARVVGYMPRQTRELGAEIESAGEQTEPARRLDLVLRRIERAADDCGLAAGQSTEWENNLRVVVGRNNGRFVEVTCDRDLVLVWNREDYIRLTRHLGKLGRRAKADWCARIRAGTDEYRYRYEWWT